MTLQFPNNPSNGQTFTASNNLVYVYDGEKWITTGSAQANGDYVLKAGDTMTGNLTVPSLNGGQLAGFRNQLINGDFRVWQRGNSFANGSDQYTSDRWFTGLNNGSVVKVTGTGGSPDAPEGFFNSLQATPNAGAMWVGQPVELPGVGAPGQFAVGTTWTASFWGKALSSTSTVKLATYFASSPGGAGAVGIQSSTNFTLTTSWQKFEWTFTINAAPGSTNTLLNLIIESTTASQTCRFAGCQLEPGPVATPFEHRPIGTELALCQRYYIDLNDSNLRFPIVQSADATGCIFIVPTGVPMRAAPTITGNVKKTGVNTGSSLGTAAGTASLTGPGPYVRISSSSGFVATTSPAVGRVLGGLDAEL